jgi:hypothetical protein
LAHELDEKKLERRIDVPSLELVHEPVVKIPTVQQT